MGFYVEEPEHHNAALPDLIGPILRLVPTCTAYSTTCQGVYSATWEAALLVAYRSPTNGKILQRSTDVTCEWKLDGTDWRRLHDFATLDVHQLASEPAFEWQCLRFTLPTVPLKDEAQVLHYRIRVKGEAAVSAQIPIAALREEWRCVVYSCYDQRRGLGHTLWKNIAEKAKKGEPTHVLLGAGDQLYNDNVWMLESLQTWLKDKDPDRLQQEPADDAQKEIADFYFSSYLRFLHFHPAAELFRSTPQLNTWDDHDSFDGWGSYPTKLQSCPMFAAIFKQSQHFYLIFQLATTLELAAADGFFVVPPSKDCPEGYSAVNFATQLGPSMAVVAPDSRSQRSKTQILSEGTFNWLIMAMQQYPEAVKHVLFLSAIPLLYPSLGILETLQKAVNNQPAKMLFKTGLYDSIYDHFDQPKLLDDATDHWSSSVHVAEKAKLLKALVDTAAQCHIRVSVASGDVHLCALGYMQSKGKSGQVQTLDPGFIPQIVTSAIGNKPPSNMVVSYIEQCTKVRRVGDEFQEGVAEIFQPSQTPGKSTRFNNRQNYCELRVEEPVAAETMKGGLPACAGCLNFNLVVLGGDPITGEEMGDVITHSIPPLLPTDAPDEILYLYPEIEQVPPPKMGLSRYLCCSQ